MGAAPIVVPQPCPSGTLDLGNGTCEAPAQVIEAAPVYVAPAPAAVCPAGTFFDGGACVSHTVQDTIITGGEYCYGDGSAVYDSRGRKIKDKAAHSMGCATHN